jgi:hypothetical protein
MRMIYCSFLLLAACATHDVRCDRHLQPINPPAAKVLLETPPARSAK